MAEEVSILTRPEGRVQRDGSPMDVRRIGFNPHPSRRTGATTIRQHSICIRTVSILTRPEGRVQHAFPEEFLPAVNLFQSSPVPKDGCNLHQLSPSDELYGFNPHPSRRTGATCAGDNGLSGAGVSILTRPEGRVQLFQRGISDPHIQFQSSPVPKDGCNAEPPNARFSTP